MSADQAVITIRPNGRTFLAPKPARVILCALGVEGGATLRNTATQLELMGDDSVPSGHYDVIVPSARGSSSGPSAASDDAAGVRVESTDKRGVARGGCEAEACGCALYVAPESGHLCTTHYPVQHMRLQGHRMSRDDPIALDSIDVPEVPAAAAAAPADPPQGIVKRLLPHQIEESAWMASIEESVGSPIDCGGGILAYTRGGRLVSEAGTGKTLSLVALAISLAVPDLLKLERTEFWSRATLIACPSHIVSQWAEEIRAYSRGLGKAPKIVCLSSSTDLEKHDYISLCVADFVVASTPMFSSRTYESIGAHADFLDLAKNSTRRLSTWEKQRSLQLRSAVGEEDTLENIESKLQRHARQQMAAAEFDSEVRKAHDLFLEGDLAVRQQQRREASKADRLAKDIKEAEENIAKWQASQRFYAELKPRTQEPCIICSKVDGDDSNALAIERQAIGRAFRIGQANVVTVESLTRTCIGHVDSGRLDSAISLLLPAASAALRSPPPPGALGFGPAFLLLRGLRRLSPQSFRRGDPGEWVLLRRALDRSSDARSRLFCAAISAPADASPTALWLAAQWADMALGDVREAVALYRRSSAQGHALSLFCLGVCAQNGDGFDKADPVEAVRLYAAASTLGLAVAHCRLALCYEAGVGGLASDTREAVRLYRLAAAQRDPWGLYGLAALSQDRSAQDLIPRDESLRACEEAAEQGMPMAIFMLGLRAPSTEESARHYMRAAELGYAPAQCNLGCLYKSGSGVPRDVCEAARLYALAAAQGLPSAQFNLALCLMRGEGTEADPAQACTWFEAAARGGDADARFYAADLRCRGAKGLAQDVRAGVRLLGDGISGPESATTKILMMFEKFVAR
eukprot:m51a1_g4058 hypothetical protein (861) ;mRNA; r:714586-720098